MTHLFTPRILTGFTTYPSSDDPILTLVTLADKELGVHRVTSSTTHKLVIPPVAVPGGDATTQAWEAVFPEGSINPGNKTSPHGGFGFYLRGPIHFADALKELERHAEVVFGYSVLFEEGFEFVKGGKLPGIYGVGELYAYLPQTDRNTERLLLVPPQSIQHPDYGFSVGRGAFSFTPGQWTRVTQRVKMNSFGKQDGEIEVYINGQSVLCASGLELRTNEGPDGRVQGLHMQTFFGGHTPDWASPKDQRAWFANISGAILKPAYGHDEL
ncbi:hypothetical protein GSI_05045 [Ganoderma sinense ZZ0214-1]|uniref:Polysaccharide lyase 14 domain-containing protein n=1 Tax=Ganoderma sinense ZZ0214-1 TaxID=1077348 RepID=A0A2G8SGU8_9APHY|nr:hypothetical protein GSI_05045 [Ganoderma sinense ZZ0214-1]